MTFYYLEYGHQVSCRGAVCHSKVELKTKDYQIILLA